MTSSTFTGETGSRKVEEIAHRHPGLVTFARLGWVAKGIVYLVVGLLAIPIAVDGLRSATAPRAPTRRPARSGAVAKIAETSFGSLALWVIAIGLAALRDLAVDLHRPAGGEHRQGLAHPRSATSSAP